jgi:DNA repair protein RecN (Recombination protein N)
MLKTLHISNYALISEINIGFSSGFSVITGETGAGKSIIIGALSLILGQRAESRFIKEGEEKAVVEAEFDIRDYHLEHFFEKNELDYQPEQCILRREITASGKSRAFINDTPVSLQVLREISAKLIDIHSQHENLLLSDDQYQLQVVDNMAQNTSILKQYQQHFTQWKNLQTQLYHLQKTADKQLSELDYMKFQFQQLEAAQLSENEQNELEMELETLSHTEEIKQELQKAVFC